MRIRCLNQKISLLQSLREFIHVYPREEDSLFIHISEMGFDHINSRYGHKHPKSKHWIERVIYEKVGYIKKRNSNASQNVRNTKRIMRDPFLMLLRKSAGLTEELTPAEYSALLNKEIQTEVTDPQKFNFTCNSVIHRIWRKRGNLLLQERLWIAKNYPQTSGSFIEQSLSRLLNPDIYDGGIGLIILEIQENSMLSERLNIGDVIFKINGNVLLEPAEILSTMATASKEENILLEVYTKEQKRISISLPGRTHLECIVSQSVMLNLFFI